MNKIAVLIGPFGDDSRNPIPIIPGALKSPLYHPFWCFNPHVCLFNHILSWLYSYIDIIYIYIIYYILYIYISSFLLVVHHVRSPLFMMKVAPVLLRSEFWICRRSPVETRPLRFASLRGQRRHQPCGPEDGRGFATLQAFLGPHAVRIFGR